MKDTQTNNYIFIDESGKPEIFSSNGTNLVEKNQATKYLILAAIRSANQLELQQQITKLKLEILQDESLTSKFSTSYSLDSFHAQTDYDQVKERFYAYINTLDIKIDVMVVEKLKCYPSLQKNPGRLYGVMSGQLLKNICHQNENTEIIFSRKDSKLKLQQELEIEVERIRLEYMKEHPNLSENMHLDYKHNPHYSHGGLQVADYVAYAVFQWFERKNGKWLQIILPKIGRIQDICNKKYFTKGNPLELSI